MILRRALSILLATALLLPACDHLIRLGVRGSYSPLTGASCAINLEICPVDREKRAACIEKQKQKCVDAGPTDKPDAGGL